MFDKDKLYELIKQGYEQGLVKIVMGSLEYGCLGIVCQIGDRQFYFAGETGEEFDTVEEYLAATDINDNIRCITEAIIGIHSDIEDGGEGEATDYYEYLMERVD